jgi:hypothetical protein
MKLESDPNRTKTRAYETGDKDISPQIAESLAGYVIKSH